MPSLFGPRSVGARILSGLTWTCKMSFLSPPAWLPQLRWLPTALIGRRIKQALAVLHSLMNRSCLYTSAAPRVRRDFHSQEHTFLSQHRHFCICGSILIWVDSFVFGGGPSVARQQMEAVAAFFPPSLLSSFATSYSHPLPGACRFSFFCCRAVVGRRCAARSRFKHVRRGERKHAKFASETESRRLSCVSQTAGGFRSHGPGRGAANICCVSH